MKKIKGKKEDNFSVESIVNEVKKDIEKRNPLYEKYLEEQSVSYLDPVEDQEFLIEGWSEAIIYKGQIVRVVQKEFSFFLDISSAKELVVSACIKTEDPYSNFAKLALYIGKQKLGEAIIKYSRLHSYTFQIPPGLQGRKVTIKGTVSFNTQKGDLYMRYIAGYNKDLSTNQMEQTLFAEINHHKMAFEYALMNLTTHRVPDLLLPTDTKFKFLKKLILKVIKPYTAPQVGFNTHVTDALSLLNNRISNLEKLSFYILQMKKK